MKQVQNFHLGRIFATANGRAPFEAKVVACDAMVLDTIGKLPFVAFGEGTDKGANSRAKFDAAAVSQSCKACHDACQAPQ